MTREKLAAEQGRLESAFRDVVFPPGLKLYRPASDPRAVFFRYGGAECAEPEGLVSWIMFELPKPGSLFDSEFWTYGFDPLHEDIEKAIDKASGFKAARREALA